MKRILAAFAVLALMASGIGIAEAKPFDLRQKATGSTVWVDRDGKEIPVGDNGITVRFSDISTAATQYVVAHRPGLITKAYGVTGSPGAGGTGTDSTISFWLEASATNSNFIAVSGLELTMSALSDAGTDESDTPNGFGGKVGQANNTVTQGQVIAIHTDGSSTGTTPVTITIVIE